MGYQTLFQSRSGAVTTVTLNRPEARNALDLVMRRELTAVLDEIEADAEARVLILTGAGGHFCSGGDVKINGGPLVKINTVEPVLGPPAPPPDLWMEKDAGPVY